MTRHYACPFAVLCAFLLLLAIGCGGGGGSDGSSPSIIAGEGTIYGKVTAPAVFLQKLNSVSTRAEQAGNGVVKAMVWLEESPEKVVITDENGAFTITGVSLGTAHRVVCRYEIAATGEVFLVRSAETVLNSANPFQRLDDLTLEQGKYTVAGILRNQLGLVIVNAQLSIWGIKFQTNSQGYFVTPPLPESAGNETINIIAAGFRPMIITLPFLHSQNNSLSMEITMSDLNEPNIAPIVFFSEVPPLVGPGQTVQLKVSIIDPDELNTNQFKPEWSSIAGFIEPTADPFIISWTAPDATGLATVTARVTDSRGASGTANISIAVGGDKNQVIRVTSVTPAGGAPGTKVAISGSGFGDATTNSRISFNGTPAKVISWTNMEIITEVPAAAATGILLISGSTGEKSAGIFTILDSGLSISPAYGPAGTIVAISGTDFGTTQGQSSVLVNGILAAVTSWSDTSIKITVPDGATAGVITIKVRDRQKSAGMFIVTRVFKVSTEKVTTDSVITITGEGWGAEQSNGSIEFSGGIAASVLSWSDAKVVIKVPGGARTGDLKASIQGISFVVTSLTINAISQVTPERGIAGNEMIVTGTGFGESIGSNYVTIGETRVEIIAWADNSIKLRIPPGTRPGNLVVHANAIESNGFPVVVTGITSISAIRRPAGASVKVNGYGFGLNSGFVFFGESVSTDFSIWQDNTIEVVIPETATGSAPLIVSAMGVRSPAVPFDVTWFESIDQTEGWPGREVIIRGNKFGNASPGDAVSFNGVKAPVISWDESEIHVRVPAETTSGQMILTISSWPIILEEEFAVFNTYDYAQLSPDWSGPRANSKPLLPGLAEDANENLFITDFDNGWVWKIAKNGTQLKFGNLDKPWGIAISPVNNNLYVADSGNHCIRVFDLNGNFISTIGDSGTGDGEFTTPRGLAFDNHGRLYVADSGNNRVQIFAADVSHTFLTELGSIGSGNGQFASPSGVAIDSSLTLYVADAGNHRIQRFSPDSTTSPSSWSFSGWIGSKDPNAATPGWLINGSGLASTRNGEFRNPYGIGLAADSALLVADSNNNRVQVIDSVTGNFVNKIGAAGTTLGQYNQPLAVIHRDGLAVIADSSNSRIQKSTLAGAYISQIIPDTSLLNTNPKRIAIDSTRRRVYVLDTDDGSITVFGLDGNVLQIIGSTGSGLNQFYKPEGLALDENGNLFVADTGNARIHRVSPEGNFIQSWGAYGKGAGQFFSPVALAVSYDGEFVFVADSELHRVQKFTKSGDFISSWGSPGDSDDNFNTPSGIVVDRSGTVYIADTLNHRIKKYTSEGNLIGWWGSYDAGAQSFWLDPGSNRTGAVSGADGGFDTPTDVAVDHEGNVFVTDSGNFRIQRFVKNQAIGLSGGYQGEIYIGDNLLSLAIDDWATVYSVTSNKTVTRYTPDL